MKYNTETFIEKAKEVHGSKYDYSKVNYVDSKTKVCIICPKHGEFWQRPADHLRGCGCWKCGGKKSQSTKPKTTDNFIIEAKQVHSDKYDYSKVDYKGAFKKVCVICPKHGEFWQLPIQHLQGHGCPKCGEINRRQNTRKNTEWFIKKAKEVHGDKYNYSKTEYIHSMSGVCITCPTHGDFWMPPNRHLQGHGCPKCGGNEKLTTERFIEKSKQVHGSKYDYSKVEYKGNFEKVCIICPKHGEFWQYANQHMQGRGCPHCRQSSLEKEIRDFLDEEKIEYVAQKRANWLDRQSLDFYLPKYNIAIECQGIQHFKPSEYFGGEERYKRTIELDRNKNKICQENGINILYYSHYDYEYVFEIIKDLITLKEKIYGFTSI